MIKCDYGNACPGHADPMDRPCGYASASSPPPPSPAKARLVALIEREFGDCLDSHPEARYNQIQRTKRAELLAAVEALEAEQQHILKEEICRIEKYNGKLDEEHSEMFSEWKSATVERDQLRAALRRIVDAWDARQAAIRAHQDEPFPVLRAIGDAYTHRCEAAIEAARELDDPRHKRRKCEDCSGSGKQAYRSGDGPFTEVDCGACDGKGTVSDFEVSLRAIRSARELDK